MPNKPSLTSNSATLASILDQAYQQFSLKIGEQAVLIPYRRNQSGEEPGPEFQGKSSPEVILAKTKELAKQANFDLNSASVEQIRQFMIAHKLGLDCSGFIYRMLDYLALAIYHKPLTELGFDHVGRTNIAKLTESTQAIKIDQLSLAQPGDIIRLSSSEPIWHGLVVLNQQADIITYAHSSGVTPINGVHQGQIKNQQLSGELAVFSFDEAAGDGLYRLKILS